MNFLYSIYFALPNFGHFGWLGKVIDKIMLITMKRVFDFFIPPYFRRTENEFGLGINTEKREETYIVSLTSFPGRINEIWITIESILRQSFKPDMIILWLAEDQFPDKILPESLIKLQSRGLTIEFCNNLRSHKKYYYSLLKFPDSNIITLDDDLYYPRNVLLNIVELHKWFPGLITTNRAHRITFNKMGINSYRKWKHEVTETVPSHLLVATGGAGTLYPPRSLHYDAFDQELMKKLCFHADDLWLKVMGFKNNTMVVTNRRFNKMFASVASTQDHKLVSLNVIGGGNDIQLHNLLNHYRIELKVE